MGEWCKKFPLRSFLWKKTKSEREWMNMSEGTKVSFDANAKKSFARRFEPLQRNKKKTRKKFFFAFPSCRRMMITLKIIRHELWIMWNLNKSLYTIMMVNHRLKEIEIPSRLSLLIKKLICKSLQGITSCLQTSFLFHENNKKKIRGTFAIYLNIKCEAARCWGCCTRMFPAAI